MFCTCWDDGACWQVDLCARDRCRRPIAMRGCKYSTVNEVAHMESSLVEFTLDNRSIDEVRFCSRLARAFLLTLPTVPAIRGEWKGVPILVVGLRGEILEDIFSCLSPSYCHNNFFYSQPYRMTSRQSRKNSRQVYSTSFPRASPTQFLAVHCATWSQVPY